MYSNGHIVNARSNICLDVASYGGTGDIGTAPCEEKDDQKWTKVLPSGDYFSLANKKSNQCLDVYGYNGVGNVATYNCEDLDDQRFKFVPSGWYTPVGDWKSIANMENGGISTRITSSLSTSVTETRTLAVTLSMEVESGTEFLKTRCAGWGGGRSEGPHQR